MAKDDLKLKDLFTHLVDWIKGKFSEQDTKIAANKYTLPQATEYELGGVKTRSTYPGERYSGKVVTEQYVCECSDALFDLMDLSTRSLKDEIKNKTSPATASTAGLVKIVTAIGEQDSAIVPTLKYIEAYLNDFNNSLGYQEGMIQKKADKSELSDYAKTSALSNYATTSALTSLQSTINNKADKSDLNSKANASDLTSLRNIVDSKVSPATASKEGIVKLLDNENSVLYPDFKGTAAGVSHVDNVIKSMEVGMSAQLNLKQDKIKIVTTEPTASSTASDPEGTIYFKV